MTIKHLKKILSPARAGAALLASALLTLTACGGGGSEQVAGTPGGGDQPPAIQGLDHVAWSWQGVLQAEPFGQPNDPALYDRTIVMEAFADGVYIGYINDFAIESNPLGPAGAMVGQLTLKPDATAGQSLVAQGIEYNFGTTYKVLSTTYEGALQYGGVVFDVATYEGPFQRVGGEPYARKFTLSTQTDGELGIPFTLGNLAGQWHGMVSDRDGFSAGIGATMAVNTSGEFAATVKGCSITGQFTEFTHRGAGAAIELDNCKGWTVGRAAAMAMSNVPESFHMVFASLEGHGAFVVRFGRPLP